jgi:hypothetical protein
MQHREEKEGKKGAEKEVIQGKTTHYSGIFYSLTNPI